MLLPNQRVRRRWQRRYEAQKTQPVEKGLESGIWLTEESGDTWGSRRRGGGEHKALQPGEAVAGEAAVSVSLSRAITGLS